MAPSEPSSAIASLKSLQKILRLERERRYQNTAVVGGLDRFLQRFTKIVESLPEGKLLIQHGMLSVSYHDMDNRRRVAWMHEVERILGWPSTTQPKATGPRKRPPGNKVVRQARAAVTLDEQISVLTGVGAKVASSLKKRFHVETIRHLLYLFPNRHIDFSNPIPVKDIEIGPHQTMEGIVWDAREISIGRRGRMKATEAILGDDSGNVRVMWWGQPYLARILQTNTRLAINGKVSIFNGRKVFESPEYEVISDKSNHAQKYTGRMVPVYPTPEGLSPRTVRRVVRTCLDISLPLIQDSLPDEACQKLGIMGLKEALWQAHYPDSEQKKEFARQRLAFDEFLLMQLAVLGRRKAVREEARGIPLKVTSDVLQAFLRSLPFDFTNAQHRTLEEISEDLRRGDHPMSRLLQGDVGSGKTVVALAALLIAATNHYQGAFMVPTEVLAEQHFLNLTHLLSGLSQPTRDRNCVSVYLGNLPRPISLALLTGSTSSREKTEIHKRAADGSIDILVGTQALIQKGLDLRRLALAVVDEQHRFGVLQRATLRQKGQAPHLLAMSATPIPRTLALTLYGDLDISTLDELPPGRQPITTKNIVPENRDAAYDFVRKQVSQGRQAFVICPLIEESEVVQTRAATEVYDRLSTSTFPDLCLGLLHGRMGIREKQAAMDAFRSGQTDILVSTSVVEVGIDVPNATVMLIEGADRFGLSQLHQLRGRVGRGDHKSYCLLLADSPSQDALERLYVLEHHSDGFALAEADLHLRGPGDFFGTRQSGLPILRVARLSDRDLLARARSKAASLLDSDPGLCQHPVLRANTRRYSGEIIDEWS
jgi:ATP-dependent DNA helicase RecG